jgi:hypothetical protein
MKNVTWDLANVREYALFVLPVLSFVNQRVHPVGSEVQLHSIVLQGKSESRYERVGYFWTVDAEIIKTLSNINSQGSESKKVVLV